MRRETSTIFLLRFGSLTPPCGSGKKEAREKTERRQRVP